MTLGKSLCFHLVLSTKDYKLVPVRVEMVIVVDLVAAYKNGSIELYSFQGTDMAFWLFYGPIEQG